MTHSRNRRRGFSLIELLIVITIILIIITFAVPKLQQAHKFAQETAAVVAVKSIHTVQVQYYSTYGRYACSLAELGPPASGGSSAAAADLLGSDITNGTKQGYKFTLTCAQGGYQVLAVPETFGTSGSKTLFSDQTMVVHEHFGPEPATAQDPVMK